MMPNFENYRLDRDREGDKNLSPDTSSAFQSLLFRLGLGTSPSLENQIKSQEDALGKLSHPDWIIRVEAVRILAASEKQELIEPLISLLQDKNVAVREAIAKALGILGGKASIDPLISYLKDEEWSVRATALQSLGKLGNLVPIESLVVALEDEDVSVRLAAMNALENQARKVPLEIFITVLKDKDDLVRRAATRVIERLLEDPEHWILTNTLVDTLMKNANNEEEIVRLIALKVLGKLATFALTEGVYRIRKDKTKITREVLPQREWEQKDRSLVESTLFLPTEQKLVEYLTTIRSQKLASLLRLDGLNEHWPIGLQKFAEDVPELEHRLDMKNVECVSWKNDSKIHELGRQGVSVGSDYPCLVQLKFATSNPEKFRHSTWPSLGAYNLKERGWRIAVVFFLPQKQSHSKKSLQLVEWLLSLLGERQNSSNLEGRDLFRLEYILKHSPSSVITKGYDEDLLMKREAIGQIQHGGEGEEILLPDILF